MPQEMKKVDTGEVPRAEDFVQIYAEGAAVIKLPNDFRIILLNPQPIKYILTKGQANIQYQQRTIAEITMPHQVAEALYIALGDQLEKTKGKETK